MTMNLSDLAKPFPESSVHWRAQTLTQSGDKALALAYIDARDVMDRLDEVCGPAGWQSEITETAKGRVICRLGILIEDHWVWKSDGAGDTDVEGDKGGISDALKRAAVSWGVGRYLYRLDAVWAPCETYEKGGKKYWRAWKGSPWDFVRNRPKSANHAEAKDPGSDPPPTPVEMRDRMLKAIKGADSTAKLEALISQAKWEDALSNLDEPKRKELGAAVDKRRNELAPKDDLASDKIPY